MRHRNHAAGFKYPFIAVALRVCLGSMFVCWVSGGHGPAIRQNEAESAWRAEILSSAQEAAFELRAGSTGEDLKHPSAAPSASLRDVGPVESATLPPASRAHDLASRRPAGSGELPSTPAERDAPGISAPKQTRGIIITSPRSPARGRAARQRQQGGEDGQHGRGTGAGEDRQHGRDTGAGGDRQHGRDSSRPALSSPTPTPPGGWWYASGSPNQVQRRLEAKRKGKWLGEEVFNKVDTNNDGRIDRTEWHRQGHDDATFDRIDTNHDGKINRPEWAAQGRENRAEKTLRSAPGPVAAAAKAAADAAKAATAAATAARVAAQAAAAAEPTAAGRETHTTSPMTLGNSNQPAKITEDTPVHKIGHHPPKRRSRTAAHHVDRAEICLDDDLCLQHRGNSVQFLNSSCASNSAKCADESVKWHMLRCCPKMCDFCSSVASNVRLSLALSIPFLAALVLNT